MNVDLEVIQGKIGQMQHVLAHAVQEHQQVTRRKAELEQQITALQGGIAALQGLVEEEGQEQGQAPEE